jgi:hypothetical protein
MPGLDYLDGEDDAAPAVAASAGNGRPNPISDQPPAYKREVISQSQWDQLRRAFDGKPSYGFNQKHALSRTYAEEGGMRPNKENHSIAGILKSTFAQLNAENQNRLNVNDPTGVLQTYDAYFNKALRTVNRNLGVTGSEALNEINDPDSAAALADTIFRHGARGGTRLIQQIYDGDYLDVDFCSAALVAAEILAHAGGNGSADLPDGIVGWLKEHGSVAHPLVLPTLSVSLIE